MDIFIDKRRDRLVELELQRRPVLDVVFWECEPIVGEGSSRLYEVLTKTNADKVPQPDRRHRQDRHRHSNLRQDGSSNWCMAALQAGLLQKLSGQVDDP